MIEIKPADIIDVQRTKKYPIFESGIHPYNLNIVGIRSKERTANKFDDLFFVYWFYPTLQCRIYEGTTDPGTYWLENHMNVNGTAILVPGFYHYLWKIGMHLGKYPALVQYGDCQVYRDNNRDNILNIGGPVDSGNFGINMHKQGTGETVDKWSAGCQVHKDSKRFDLDFMPMIYEASKYWGPRFSYTLLEEKDFD